MPCGADYAVAAVYTKGGGDVTVHPLAPVTNGMMLPMLTITRVRRITLVLAAVNDAATVAMAQFGRADLPWARVAGAAQLPPA